MRPRVFMLADRVAPAVSIGIMVLMLVVSNLDTLRHPAAPAYFQRVADEIDSIPFRIGGFVGFDQEVTPAAVQLLKPNRLLQRAYVDVTGRASATLLFVHCEDVRDMIGHFPPICYPAHGWRLESTEEITIAIGGEEFPAKVYEFQPRLGSSEPRMHVLNFFILPLKGVGIGIVPDRGAATAHTGSRRAAGLGAGQVQIVATDRSLLTSSGGIRERMLEALEPAVREISRGPISE